MTYREHFDLYLSLHDAAMESLKKSTAAITVDQYESQTHFDDYKRLITEASRHLAIYKRVSTRKFNETMKRLDGLEFDFMNQ